MELKGIEEGLRRLRDMKNKIIPTVFAHNAKDFNKRFSKLIKIANYIQIDFMDGKFVSGKSIELNKIPNLKKYKNNFEAHLMVKNPQNWVKRCLVKGFDKIIFHIEAVRNAKEAIKIIDYVKNKGKKCFVAINPSTPLERIIPLIIGSDIDGILIMGVYPGKEHQNLVGNVFARIRQIKKLNKKIVVQIDGGVNDKTALRFSRAGEDLINTGSFVSEAKNPKKALMLLEKKFK